MNLFPPFPCKEHLLNMAGVNRCMKYSMFLFNFLFWVCGCVILGVSIWLRVSPENKQKLVNQESYVFSAIDVMIAAGAIIMVLGFLGCCGAVKESPCLLLLFFIGLFLILALQVTAGILAAVYKPQSEEKVKEMLQKVIPLNTKPELFRQIVETIQEENKCCGIVNGASDWGNRPPESCSCSSPSKCRNGYYEQTCTSSFIAAFTKPHLIIIGIAFGLLVVELCGLGLSMTLYCQIRKK